MRSHFFLLLCILIAGCNSNDSEGGQKTRSERNSKNWSEIPPEVRIDSMTTTDFVPTLESRVEPGKNIVYAAALLYAWDEFRKIGGLVTVPDTASEDLKKLHNSRSHQNTLDKGEYSAAGELVNGMIEVRAFFNKTLPFEIGFQPAEPILFGMDTVRSFGASSHWTEFEKQLQILYFKSDSQFVIALNPADSAHQIIIAMGVAKSETLAAAIKKIKASVLAGESERKRSANAWRYTLGDGDVVSIPEFRYNISKHYRAIEDQPVITGTVERTIAVAYQRTALVLNRYGAVVESEVSLTTDSASAEIPKPKRLVCDRPFYVIIQHRDRQNPYFVMKVENSELMERE